MIEFFLRAKHWHIFLLILGLPVIFQLYYLFELFVQGNYQVQTASENIQDYLWYIPLLCLAAVLGQLAWNWSVATGLQEKIPAELRLNLRRFNWVTGLVVAFNVWFFTIFLADVFAPPDQQLVLASNSRWLWYFVPLTSLGTLGLIYLQYITAKSIALARKQGRVRIGSWLGYFLLQVVFLLGIWFLQPRVQKAAASNDQLIL